MPIVYTTFNVFVTLVIGVETIFFIMLNCDKNLQNLDNHNILKSSFSLLKTNVLTNISLLVYIQINN